MATYKDDLDIIKAAEKDSSKLSLNAITELDNKGMLGMYGGGGGGDSPFKTAELTLNRMEMDRHLAWYGTDKGTGRKTVYTSPKPDSRLYDDSKLVVPVELILEYEESRGTMPSLFSVEGDAELFDYPDDQVFSIYITGDCVITYTGDENWPKQM